MRVLIISADGFEDSELLVPMYRVQEAGGLTRVASTGADEISGKKGYRVSVDLDVAQINPDDFDALVLPGGKAPAILRENETVLETARAFMKADKPVAAICHGPQILASAGVIEGREMTAYPKVADELTAAGGRYRDEEVVVDGKLVTSRIPRDLPAFNRELMRLLQ